MKKVYGIIKINILSLIALPLLLLAVGVKLLAKALERIIVGIGAVALLLAAMLISYIIQRPGETFSILLMVILVLLVVGAIILFICFLFSFAASLIMTAAGVIVTILEVIYELLYGWYSALYNKCKRSYEQLDGVTSPVAKRFSCLLYSILRIVNSCVFLFVNHALKLLIAASILIALGILYSINRQFQTVLGLNLLTAVGMYPVRDVIVGVIFYVALVVGIGALLISFGFEWNEWGREMKMATDDYEEYLGTISQTNVNLDEEEDVNQQNEAVLRCREYMDKMNRHFEEVEKFQAETQRIIQKSENQMLRSLLGEYMSVILELLKKMQGTSSNISVEEFEKLIPKIKRLDVLKEDIRKLNIKMASYTPPVTGTGFFAGCDNLQKLEKRYKALCKTYHPDSEAGDEETFKKMQNDYEELKAKLGK